MFHLGHLRNYYNRRLDERRLADIYRRFSAFTMISEQDFVNTLRLAERVNGIEGCVVQCGVWKGGMGAGLASVIEGGRQYFLFDSFQGLPLARDIDGLAAKVWQANTNGPTYYDNCRASLEDARSAMKLSGTNKYELFEGWFEDTLPAFVPPEPIAFLHLDADWYESTLICFEQLFDRVAVGGLIVLDDYYVWDGCSRAVHEFLTKRQAVERVRNLGNLCYLEKVGVSNSAASEARQVR